MVFTPENLKLGEERDPTFSTSTLFAFSEFSALSGLVENPPGFEAAVAIVLPVEDPKMFLVSRGLKVSPLVVTVSGLKENPPGVRAVVAVGSNGVKENASGSLLEENPSLWVAVAVAVVVLGF